MSPSPDGSPHRSNTNYLLWEVVLSQLAGLAPTLKEAELRVLLELCHRRDPSTNTTAASSRDLAKSCNIARSAIVPALATWPRSPSSLPAKAQLPVRPVYFPKKRRRTHRVPRAARNAGFPMTAAVAVPSSSQ